jgi:undecaprenyl-phosphate 4-deoxy-4-formamido-L-arabinose transferase
MAIEKSDIKPSHTISVVIPVYNSEPSLPELMARLTKVLPSLCQEYEIICVDDGSHDQSWAVLQRLTDSYPELRSVKLLKNSGQHNALLCGTRLAKYELVVTMDDDLQHPPEEIHKLIEKLDEGYDVVYGYPDAGPHELWRNFSSKITKKVLAFVMGIPTVVHIGPFRVFRTNLRRAFEQFCSPGVILDVLLSWGTSRFSYVEVREDTRKYGQTNYNFRKLVSTAFLVLTGYSTFPLRLASMIGFVITLFGLGVFIYVICVYLTQGSLPGFPFLASIITVFSGAQLFALGIFGEYIASIFNRSMDRPAYVIDRIVDQPDKGIQ